MVAENQRPRPGDLVLDHVGHFVPDLDAAAKVLAELGFFATPVMSLDKSIPLPHSWKVTFTKAGTFKYFCWIHGPDMSGTIVVTP